MTTTVTIIKDGVTNAYGLPLLKGSSYAVDDSFAQGLVQQQSATLVAVQPLPNPPYENAGDGAVPGLMVNENSVFAAKVNTTLIQAALNAGGLVQIVATPGTYYVNDTLTVYSNTEIVLGAGVLLRQYSSTNKPIFRNANYAATKVTASGNISTATTALTGNLIASVSITGLGVSAGDYVYITGDTSGGAGGTYNGCHRVQSYDGSTLTFLVKASSTVSTSSGTIKIAKADANITLRGGVLDYDSANNSGATGNNTHMVVFNQVGNVRIMSQEARNALKYCYYFGSFDGVYINDVNFLTGSDGVHFAGPGANVQVSNLRGETGDDMVAFTTGNGTEYATYDLANCDGDINNIQITNLQERQGTAHRCVLLEAVEGYTIRGVKIDGVEAMYSGCIAVMLTARDTYSGTITDVSVKNIAGVYGTTSYATVLIAGPATSGTLTVGDVSIDGVKPSVLTSGAELLGINGRVTFKTIKAANLVQRPLSIKNVVYINGTNVVGDQVIIENSRADMDCSSNAAANQYLVQLANAQVKNIIIDKCYLVTGGAVVRVHGLCSLVAPGVVMKIDVSRSYHEGSSLCCTASSVTNVPTFTLNQTRHNGGYGISVGNDSVNINVNQIEIVASSFGAFFNLGGTSKTYGMETRGIRNTGAVTLMAYGTTNTFNLTGSDGSMTLKTDTAGHTFNISAGCILNDTQAAAAGVYAKGPTAYTRIAA